MDKKWWTLTAVSVGAFMLLLDVTIVNVALPDIQRQLGGSLSDLQWIIDAYALSLAALLLTAGSIADLRGRRILFEIGIVVFTGGSLACGLAPTPLFLSLARAGQGVGGAIMLATALALIAHTFRGHDRGVAFGVFGAVTGIAVAVGPVAGGAITSGLSWRWIFLVNVPIGIATLAVTAYGVQESRDPDAKRPDWIGFATFSGSLFALVYGLIKSGVDGWHSHLVIGCTAAAVLLMIAFAVSQARQQRSMLDMRLLRVPTFVGGIGCAFAISASLFSALTFIVLYFQDVLGYSAIGTGVRLLALTGAMFLTAGVAGRLTARVPARLLIGPGFLLVGTGLLLMRGLNATSAWTHLLPGLIAAGAGGGLVNVPLASTAVGIVSPSRAGMASGVNSTFRQVGVAAGIAALGSIFAAQIKTSVIGSLAHTKLAPISDRLAAALSTGHVSHTIATAPPATRQQIAHVSVTSFVTSLDNLLLIASLTAFAGAVVALTLIRQEDFIEAPAHEPTELPANGAELRLVGPT
jgi:EmrB/QacA subfamily drug resistance transporter